MYLVGGCTWSGGVPGLGGVPGSGGVPGPGGVYLVRYSPLWTDTRLLNHNLRNFVADGN